ncbi:MAG: DUF4294 domain-containing protein [Bacteroidia bacterium]|nr:DUF4294 domain-containing protein [Bacteroidia bacterium]NNC85323.1 DUF4294 domain-containing protein [Bacteroidia bacterium]NNM16088.1 DUF4294 domain-containing protein [Bacteroidia bacterium]
MKKLLSIFLFSILLGGSAFAQLPEGWAVSVATVHDGDTLPTYNAPVVDIFGVMDPAAAMSLRDYQKLRYNVLKVYPYAKKASLELNQIEKDIEGAKNNRHRRKTIKAREKVLKVELEDELKKLTRTQGRILIKLIDRETGETSYELIKELRGSVRAFFWQKAARFIGSNLKDEYDPEGDDIVIESIVLAIERGDLNYQNLYKSNVHSD